MSHEEKKPSSGLMAMVNEWADSYIKSTELPLKILEAAESEGLTKGQIRKIVEEVLVKRGLSERRIREVLPKELKDMSKVSVRNSNAAESAASTSEPSQTVTKPADDKIPADSPPPDPDEYLGSPEQEIKKIGEIRRDLAKKDAEGIDLVSSQEIHELGDIIKNLKHEPIVEPDDEDPQTLEIQFLKEKVAELEDALKKTEQFKPAIQLQQEEPVDFSSLFSEESVFEWLGKRDNGVSCYWYPNYGIELFRNRILTQLKNKGVTTFKRLYFEV